MIITINVVRSEAKTRKKRQQSMIDLKKTLCVNCNLVNCLLKCIKKTKLFWDYLCSVRLVKSWDCIPKGKQIFWFFRSIFGNDQFLFWIEQPFAHKSISFLSNPYWFTWILSNTENFFFLPKNNFCQEQHHISW